VGAVAAHELALRGARVVGVSDIAGGVHDERGLELKALNEWRDEHDGIAGFPGSKDVSNAELLELPCDVLVLAATENQVTAANAGLVQTKLVAEGANGPTSLEGDEILGERGIPVLPDILTNAGGVAVSYFEWVQDIQRLFWGRTRSARASPTSWATRQPGVGPLGERGASVPRAARRHEHPRGCRGPRGAGFTRDRPRGPHVGPLVLQANANVREAAGS
jgi:hypothetical protein